MDEPKSLYSRFKEKIFRIPDYERGYALQREQLKAFWEDLVNLSDRSAIPLRHWRQVGGARLPAPYQGDFRPRSCFQLLRISKSQLLPRP